MPPTDSALRAWWPSTQSLDLIEAPIGRVVEAAHTEIARFLAGEQLATAWCEVASFDAALSTAPHFANFPTYFIVLPTHSKWTVIWNNSFLCDGYDSLCHCITANHGLPTLHWSSHDAWTTFQSGSKFCHRRREDGEVIKRSVHTAQADQRWDFFQTGSPLPEEDLAGYGALKKRDRLNEQRTMDLLARLGAEPWREAFYALPGDVFAIQRLEIPPRVALRTRDQVLPPGAVP